MNISKIDINNFRLLKQTSINCEKELSLIIDKNNCGKTSLLSALSKCIGSKSEVGKFIILISVWLFRIDYMM